jgi:OOP family OmpA-OmpF porin
MNNPIFSLSLALLMFCTPVAQASEEVQSEQLQKIESLQQRATKLASGDIGSENYYLAKAQAWLDLATSEHYEKDTSGALAAAIEKAETLLNALENKQTDINMDTPFQVPGSEAIRPDLQEQIAILKTNDKFSCGQRQIATAEIYLVWAGHEFYESGQSHAESYIRSVENLIYEGKVAMDNCAAAQVVAVAPPMEKITLSSDALFAFNKATLNASALSSLDELAENIKKTNVLEEIVLVGHTDRLRSDGRPERNQLLSEQRAESIRQFLIDKGIPAEKIHASGAGSTQPIVECSNKLSKTKQIACLQPNRRVEITLRAGNAVDENKEMVK